MAQTTFGAVGTGLNWADSLSWAPASGPPGVLDTAYIGSAAPTGAASTASIFLSGTTHVANVSIGRVSGNSGTLDLNGQTLNVSGTTELGFGITAMGSIIHNGGTLNTGSLIVRNISSFTYANSDSSNNLSVQSGGTVTTAAIGNITQGVIVNQAGSTLNLGSNMQLSLDFDVRGTGSSLAIVNANGFNISARDVFVGRFGNHAQINNRGEITATRDLESSGSTFSLNANDSVGNDVRATNGGTLHLHANTAALGGRILSGGTLNTAATTNLANFVNVIEQNSTLNLGANLQLIEDLDIRGTGANMATVNANGFNITARDIYVGRFGNHAQITNRGVITATRDLESSGSTFSLNANDSVANLVRATSGGTLNLHVSTAAVGGRAFSGGTLNTAATSNISTSVIVSEQNSTLNMGANLQLIEDLDIRGTGANMATVNANGFDIGARDIYVGRFGNHAQIINRGAITATRDLESSGSAFSLNANDSVANFVRATSGGTLNLHVNTSALGGRVFSGGTLNTAATSNIANSVIVSEQNSSLNLGANLSLSGELDIRGTAANPAFVNANGYDITANQLYMGRFDNRAELINDGAITVNQLLFDRSVLSLTGGNDTVHSVLSIVDHSTLNINQAIGEVSGLTFNGNLITIDATSLLVLNFDAQATVGLDWAFRWANPTGNDRIMAITDFVNDGRIVINSPVATAIFDGGDGYTYIGYNTIPEPSSSVLVAMALTASLLRRRQRVA